MHTPPPQPPPPLPPLRLPDVDMPLLEYHHHPFPPPTTPPTSHRKKRTKKLLLDHHRHHPNPSKKPDPAAPKITRPCTECGKKFWSWKALFGHMRCHPERQWRGINPPPHLRRPSPSPPNTMDDQDVAASLLMLAAGGGITKFECSSCKKTFGSHQALGGHRASHKNVKGCFAINNDPILMIMEAQNGPDDVELGLGLGLGLGHRCGVCLRVFSSGQALGGHMRCHWDQPSTGSGLEARCGPGLNAGPSLGFEDGSSSSSFYCSSNEVQLDLRLGL